MDRSGIGGCVLALTLLAVPASAQEDPLPRRRGFWYSIGPGYGSARAQCLECTGEREGSLTLSMRMGGTIKNRVLLGYEIAGWLKNSNGWLPSQEPVSLTLGNGSFVALVYPSSTGDLFLKAGAGLSHVGFPPRDGEFEPCISSGCLPTQEMGPQGTGLGFTAGVGYDVHLGARVSLTPEITFALGRLGQVDDGASRLVTDWRHDVVAFNVSVTFH